MTYENVDREGKNVVLEFNPHRFSAIMAQPLPEISAAGHDRLIV
jgi:hypothetical protein